MEGNYMDEKGMYISEERPFKDGLYLVRLTPENAKGQGISSCIFVEYEISVGKWYLYDTINDKREKELFIYDFNWYSLPVNMEGKGKDDFQIIKEEGEYIIQTMTGNNEAVKWMIATFNQGKFWYKTKGGTEQLKADNYCWYNLPSTYLGCFRYKS